jgi:hypothetical protein
MIATYGLTVNADGSSERFLRQGIVSSFLVQVSSGLKRLRNVRVFRAKQFLSGFQRKLEERPGFVVGSLGCVELPRSF